MDGSKNRSSTNESEWEKNTHTLYLMTPFLTSGTYVGISTGKTTQNTKIRVTAAWLAEFKSPWPDVHYDSNRTLYVLANTPTDRKNVRCRRQHYGWLRRIFCQHHTYRRHQQHHLHYNHYNMIIESINNRMKYPIDQSYGDRNACVTLWI